MESKQYKTERWWRMLLLFFVCLSGGSSPTWAISVVNTDYTFIHHSPKSNEPYLEMKMLYYDWTTGANSFWVSAPEIWVDGVKVCNAAEVGQYYDGGSGDGTQAKDDAYAYDSWWGKTYDKTNDGITYRVRFRDPYESQDWTNHRKFSCFMRVYISSMESGSTHTVRIVGKWVYNRDSKIDIDQTYSFSAPTLWNSNNQPTAVMTGYQAISASGNLNGDVGPTKIGFLQSSEGTQQIKNGAYYSREFKNPNSLEGMQSKDKNTTSFSGLTGKHTRADAHEKDGSSTSIQYAISASDNGFTTYFYKWYDVSVQGFAYPHDLESAPDQWTKSVTLTWKKEDTGRCKEGSWSIYRGNDLIESGWSYDKLSYTVPAPAYDTKYTYKVAFVPKSTPTGTAAISSLSVSKDTTVVRDWSISNFKGVLEGDNAIKLTWSHPSIIDASSSKKYTLTLERRDNSADVPAWEKVTTIDITSPDTEDGTYTDNDGLRANHSYSYRLSISLLGTTITTQDSDFNPVTLGGSEITAFTATRGTYSNVVKLSWTVRQIGIDDTEFSLYRRPLGSTDENAWQWLENFSGKATNYSYNDESVQAGNYNQYKIAIVVTNANTGKQTISSSMLTDGFTFSSGVVSGRITYGTGAGVEGAKVVLKKQNGDGEVSQSGGMHSLRFKGSRYTGLNYQSDTTEIKQLYSGDFSMQMYVYPVYEEMAANNTRYCVFDTEYNLSLYLKTNTATKSFRIVPWLQNYIESNIYIPGNQWSHISLVYKHDIDSIMIVVTKADGTKQTDKLFAQYKWDNRGKSVAIGNTAGMNANANFRGFLDEVRFFTKALTDKEIERNYNHPLAGTEDGLAIYYPMDEGIASQTVAYDFSKTNGIPNGRHASAGSVPAIATENLPSEDQLSLMNYTDENGNYTVRGVPYSGEGTAYSVVPKKGTHVFSPSSQSRFVSSSSLVHNGVDFSDISSFPVSGKVFYAGTDYPVEGVNFYVDGVACTRGGELIASAEDGSYTISVPIGDHYISVAKSGHVFANKGRYPADPFKTDTCALFKDELKGLEFQDVTLVNFAGRVVGGDIEGKKPVGFGLSENNIGVTQIVLTPLNTVPRLNAIKVVTETSFRYDTNTDTVHVASSTPVINSTSWRGAGDDDCRNIYIDTDPVTGEFSAMVPPLQYKISSMSVLSNVDVDFGELPTVDLSNPLTEISDTLKHEDDTEETYTCNALLNHIYHNPKPTFTVIQDGRKDGSFGIKSYKMKVPEGDVVIDDIYSTDGSTVTYNYGVTGHKAPLFMQDNPYSFFIEGYELYENYDASATNPVVSRVPLADVVVTIDNALSADQTVWLVTGEVEVDGETYNAQEGQVKDLESNQLVLDSLGQAVYEWHAGLPNVASPYTRTISMSYDINGKQYLWDGNGMEGIILGDLSSGNNFVTSGPDKLVMILRDPPGTGSSAEWTTGTSYSMTKLENDTWSDSFESGFTSHLGHTEEFITGTGTVTVANTTLVASSCKIEDKDDLTTHVTEENEGEKGETIETAISIEETVATSGEPDFVGADGDVFVGQATNIIFGNARHIGFMPVDGGYEVGLRNVISTGMNFGTTFSYSQSYIENTLLPNFEMMRENLLKTKTQAEIDQYNPVKGVGVHNLGRDAGNLYYTTLTPEDEHFGEDGTYTIILPDGLELMPDSIKEKNDEVLAMTWALKEDIATTDSVRWINNQIRGWKKYLAFNEEEKVKAFEKREKEDKDMEYVNYSFDGGASRTYTWEKDSTNTSSWEWSVNAGLLVGNRLGFEWNKTGVDWDLEVTVNGGRHEAKDTVNAYTTSFSYTLAEEGSDAISVDVYRYGAFGPIFRTRGGQTSNPYEGKVVTKYYEPGTTIMEATMQIEVPQIDVDVPIVSDIPTGNAANYTLRLSNASEIGEDVAYQLFMLDDTNPYSAILTIDGKALSGEGRLIKVPGNQTLTKTLQLRQGDTSILDYTGNNEPNHDLFDRGIGIVFASESQPEDIADTVFIKAYFVPSSSDVALRLSNTTMNTQTGSDLTLTFSGFDRNYHNLKAFRLQYKEPGTTDWTLLKEYVLNEKDKTKNNEYLPTTGANISYTQPMESFPDGNYLFRVVSAATYGLGEVYKYSDELALIKDMKKPTPMGQPEPTDGILDIGDELSVTFNETILNGELTQEKNFVITGVLNGSKIEHETALSMQDTETTAQTEANITLAGKDFSIDTWVNLSSAGTILSHGTASNKLTVGTDASGHLVVAIAGDTCISKNTVPRNEWVFLTLNYQAGTNGGNLSAAAATADDEISLFSGKAVAPYDGNGPLAVGQQAKGAIHELLLWDEAHDMTTALLNRTKTKNPSTRHLIGYWKMNEGEGKTIRDYSRSRHMTMSDETWYMNNVNKSVSFSGNDYIRLLTADSPYSLEDDYAVELWMRGDKQKGEAQLLQAGQVGLYLDANGQLQLATKGAGIYDGESTMQTTSPVLTDNAWHHVALNVLRQGAAAVYVDGNRVLTTNASNVGHIATNYMYLGMRRSAEYADSTNAVGTLHYERPFKGQLDEVRVWDATLNADKLSNDRKVRLTGKEAGLVAYYPFETKKLDSGNQVVTEGYDIDLVTRDSTHMAERLAPDSFTPQTLNYSDEAPAMRTKPTETNVSYTYVASDNKIVIELDENPATIDGTTINFTVRSVRDVNGNYSEPAIWSAFVNQKELVWADDALSIEQPVETSGTVTATIVNKGGKQQMWTLEGMPSWLQASSEYGTTNPRNETQVTFTVSPATPIGKYEETVYLKGNDGIYTPLTISVRVTGDKPLWSVNPGDYEGSMSIMASLDFLGTMSEDEDDIVAAFINGQCRGVAQPEYKQRYDGYMVTMTVYGMSSETDTLEFKAYDASTGIIYPVVKAFLYGETEPTFITYEENNLIGRYGTPARLSATDEIEQNIELGNGWNWMSLGVKPESFTVDNVFAKAGGKVEYVKSKKATAEMGSNGWFSTIDKMNNREMYAVQTNEALTLSVTGHRVKPSDEPISLEDGWSWVAFNGLSVMSLEYGLSDMQPQTDEIIKSQHAVAYYDNYEWSGSLKQLTPGQGYKIQAKTARPFTYPSAATTASRAANRVERHDDEEAHPSIFTPVDYHQYPANMVLIAQIVAEGLPVANADLGVFAEEECREAVVTDDRGMVYITIPGDDPCSLTFRVAIDGQYLMVNGQSINYETDAVIGTPRAPFVIDLGTATAIGYVANDSQSAEQIYDLQGRKLNYINAEGKKLRKGVYIVNGQKKVK
ncbi:MAG: hypothetical protein J6W19_10870 [Prevotella sp.]|nr:hypothetical protein [Prevotella sp.]